MGIRLLDCDPEIPKELAEEFRAFTQDYISAMMEWTRVLSRDCQDLIKRCVVCATRQDMCDECRAATGRVLEMTQHNFELEGRRREAHRKYQEWMEAHGKKSEGYDA
jgi:hypothetical protein